MVSTGGRAAKHCRRSPSLIPYRRQSATENFTAKSRDQPNELIMKESTKTAAFVGSAVAMLIASVFTSYTNQPKPNDDFETVGQPFYEGFEETNQAKSLVVTSIDPDAIKEQKFEIKQIDGLWQIPSHEGYPAEAAQRLATTAASLVGLTRDSLVGRRTSDYEKFGVVDPRTDDIIDVESVGQSVTLRDANEDVLVDLIIGDRADESSDDAMTEQPADKTFYYVRRADETNVYRIPLNIELSTKFSDWIEPDLLQLEASDVVALDVNNYQIEERSSGLFGQAKELLKVQGDKISLSRESSTDDWEMQEFDSAKEKIKQDAINAIVSVLDEMAIVDVKRKPTLDGRILLDADLQYSVTPEQAKLMLIRTQQELDALTPDQQAQFQAIQLGIMELQRDLDAKGFSFGSTGQKLELVSAGGEMKAGTSDGLRYTLHIGKAPTDTVEEIKVGGTSDNEKSNDQDTADTSEDVDRKEADTGDAADETQEDATNDTNRYVLIRVAFDETLLSDPGESPVKPTAPTKPEGYTAAPEEEPSGGDDEAKDDEIDDTEESSEDDDAAPKPGNMQRNPAFVKYDEDAAAFESAEVEYELALTAYESASKKKEAQTEAGQKTAEILNGRFEKWYYIVSSENLKTLQGDREALIEPVIVTTSDDEAAVEAKAAETTAAAMEDRPDVSFPEIETSKEQLSEQSDAAETKPIEKPPVVSPAEDGDSDVEDDEAKEESEKPAAAQEDAEPSPRETKNDSTSEATEESDQKDVLPKEVGDDVSK